MILDTSATGVPPELLAGVRTNHKGLRIVELHQARGRAGYSPVPGKRWRLDKKGEEVEHDETPDDDATLIADTLWSTACELRRQGGGDQRFAACLLCIDSKGTLGNRLVKFEVAVDDLFEKGPDVEANARASFMHELVAYANRMHTINADSAEKNAEGSRKLFDSAAGILDKVGAVLARVIDLRMDAAESEIRAALALANSKSSEDWKEAGKNFVEVAKGPVGAAMAAKLLGIEPKEAAAWMASLIGEQKGTTTTSDAKDLRSLLAKLGESLSDAQKSTLLSGLGVDALAHLQTAQKSTDDTTCREATRKFFAALGEDDSPRWKCLENTLSDEQKMLVLQAVELLTPTTK